MINRRTLTNLAARADRGARPGHQATRKRRSLAIPAVAVLAAAGVFAACNPSGSGVLSSGPLASLSVSSFAVPSLDLSSLSVPSMAIPSLGAAASGATCVGPVTAAILNQLESSSSGDLQAKLQQNRQALIVGLQAWQPQDPARVAWRDQLVTALQSNDDAGAAAKIQQISSGQVAITTC